LFSLLSNHLSDLALKTVNSGCRDSEVGSLRWKWYAIVSKLKTFVFRLFIINGGHRLHRRRSRFRMPLDSPYGAYFGAYVKFTRRNCVDAEGLDVTRNNRLMKIMRRRCRVTNSVS